MVGKIVRIVIYSLLGAIGLVVLVMVLLYHGTPRWYKPVHLSEEQLQRASGDLIREYTSLDRQMMCEPVGTSVVLRVAQDDANRYLQAVLKQAGKLDWLGDPMIAFDRDCIIVTGTVRQLGGRPVSLHLALRMVDEKLAVNIGDIHVGSLPLPRQFIADQLSELNAKVQAARPANSSARSSDLAMADLLRLGQSFLSAAVNGEQMAVEFSTVQTRRKVKVESVELTPGQLTVTFIPQGEPAQQVDVSQFPDD